MNIILCKQVLDIVRKKTIRYGILFRNYNVNIYYYCFNRKSFCGTIVITTNIGRDIIAQNVDHVWIDVCGRAVFEIVF